MTQSELAKWINDRTGRIVRVVYATFHAYAQDGQPDAESWRQDMSGKLVGVAVTRGLWRNSLHAVMWDQETGELCTISLRKIIKIEEGVR